MLFHRDFRQRQQGRNKEFRKGRLYNQNNIFPSREKRIRSAGTGDQITDLFGLIFCVGDRKLTIGDFSHDYIGEYQDILQISIEIDYKENTQKEDTAPVAREIGVEVTQG